jgi:hypothetical protein
MKSPVRCLNIVWMVISLGPYHSLAVLMIWDDIVVVGELFVTDVTLPVLLDNLPVQQLPHLCRRSGSRYPLG